MRKPTICICESKGPDQLHSNFEADQRLCFRFSDSTLVEVLMLELDGILASVFRAWCLCANVFYEPPKCNGVQLSQLISV